MKQSFYDIKFIDLQKKYIIIYTYIRVWAKMFIGWCLYDDVISSVDDFCDQ